MTVTAEPKSAAQHAAEDLAKAIARLRTDDGWVAWLKSRAALYRHSPMNQMLIWSQFPEATFCRGKVQWRTDFNRQLDSWAKPIWIRAPRTKKTGELDPKTGEEKVKTYFKNVKVYDVSMTSEIPGEEVIPVQPPKEPITGDSHQAWIVKLRMFAMEKLQVTTDVEKGEHEGWYSHSEKKIHVRGTHPNEIVHILVHECCHAAGIGTASEEPESYDRAEACCEAAGFIACSMIGLDVSGESVPYIAGWREDAEALIEQDIKRIHQVALQVASCGDKKRAAALCS